MALGPVPTISVQIGFSANATDALASVAWTDVTTYCTGFATRMGRQHELGQMEASTCDLVLDNKDGRFDPNNAGGAYYPNIRPNVRLRIQATWNAITYPIFLGNIEAWKPVWPQLNDAYVDVHAVDGLKWLNSVNLL